MLNAVIRWKSEADPGFFKGSDFFKGRGVTIHCLITKICELGAGFLYFPYVLAQNGGGGGFD